MTAKKENQDPGTVKIKEEDLTESFSLEELRNFRISAPREPRHKGATVKAPEPSPQEKQEIAGVLNDLIDEITRTEAVQLPDKIEPPPEVKTGRGSNLGDILLVTTSLKKEQLDEVLTQQAQDPGNKEKLGELLLRKKLIKEEELLKALSFQLNIPIISDLATAEIDQNLIKKVPINFAKRYNLLPIRRQGPFVQVAIHDVVDFAPLDDIRILLGCEVRPLLAKKSAIIDAINRAYDRAKETNEEMLEGLEEEGFDKIDLDEPQDLIDATDEAPIIKLVNSLLFRAVKERASDIHVEPFERELVVRFRIDGVLYDIIRPPKQAQASISSRIKIMAKLDIAEKRIPQDGRIKIRIGGKDIDIRVSTLPTTFGERIVMRLLDKTAVLHDLAEIGFSREQHEAVMKIIKKSHGIFLVTGPTGSGKTTTLYAALMKINTTEKNVITVEDPVEYQLKGIGQIHVNPKVNLTFANGLRSILRQDPDVIMVGEIRDAETAEIAIQASLTGHLVFSTLHTNDAATAFTRLIDMGVEPFLVASSVIGVMAQRLVRVVCKQCRQPYTPTPSEMEDIGLTPAMMKGAQIYRSAGCPACWNTGYSGRTGIYELLTINEKLRNLVLKNTDSATMKKVAAECGMKNLRDHGVEKVLQGVTTLEEVLRVTQEDSAL